MSFPYPLLPESVRSQPRRAIPGSSRIWHLPEVLKDQISRHAFIDAHVVIGGKLASLIFNLEKVPVSLHDMEDGSSRVHVWSYVYGF